MPVDAAVLGFTNRWFRAACETASDLDLGDDVTIRLVTAPLLLATKIEAFLDRGGGDFAVSHDLEDLLSVVDGRAEVVDEISAAPTDVRAHIQTTISGWLDDNRFLEALPGYMPRDVASQARAAELLARLCRIAGPGGTKASLAHDVDTTA